MIRRRIVITSVLLLVVLAGLGLLGFGMIMGSQKAITLTAVPLAVSELSRSTSTPLHVAEPAARLFSPVGALATVTYSLPVRPQITSTPRPGAPPRPTGIQVPTEPVSTPITATFSALPSVNFTYEIRGYAFAGTQNVWIVVNHELLHTSDRGQHWATQYGNGVTRVVFADKDHGWIIVDDTILGTEDGGQSWRLQFDLATVPTPTGSRAPVFLTEGGGVGAMSFVSTQHGWASTSVGVLTTVDGGQHWEWANTSQGIVVAQFMDDRHGWGYAGEGAADPKLSQTTDGGVTWRAWKVDIGCNWYKTGARFAFAGANTAWAVCIPSSGSEYVDPMHLQKSTDGGASWFSVLSTEPSKGVGPQSPNDSSSVQGLFFLDDKRGWVITVAQHDGSSFQMILRATQDGGHSWQTISWFDNGLNNVRFASPKIGYILSGTSLLGTTDGGNSWSQLYGAPTTPKYFKFFDPQSGVGVSTSAALDLLSRTTDGGHSWTPTGSLNTVCGPGIVAGVSGVTFPTSRNGWVILDCHDREGNGQQRVLGRSTDGGTTWHAVQTRPHDLPGGNASISFVDDQTGYIASLAKGVQVTHDGGLTFTKLAATIPPYVDPVIKFTSLDVGWMLGHGMLVTSDGGMSWRPTFAGNVDHPAFDVLSDGHIWISNALFRGISNNSACGLLSKDSGSTTWRALRLAVCPAEISFEDDLHGWLRDTSNYLYSTTDGGDSWVMLP